MTVAGWLEHRIAHLTGLAKSTLADYRAYTRNDITPVLGPIPLSLLSRDDIAQWTQAMTDRGTSGKTIANKHGFLSSALNAAVRAGHICVQPRRRSEAAENRARRHGLPVPRGVRRTARRRHPALAPAGRVPGRLRLPVGEATALRPGDIDRAKGTVRITRAWKRTYANGGYELGTPKTKRSIRTVNVPLPVLEKLDYTGEWLFTNRADRPLRHNGFHERVWAPAVARAGLKPRPRVHDLRHTCASWMVAAGVPLPVVQTHLGHESINTTISLYCHIDRRSQEAAATTIAAMLDPSS